MFIGMGNNSAESRYSAIYSSHRGYGTIAIMIPGDVGVRGAARRSTAEATATR